MRLCSPLKEWSLCLFTLTLGWPSDLLWQQDNRICQVWHDMVFQSRSHRFHACSLRYEFCHLLLEDGRSCGERSLNNSQHNHQTCGWGHLWHPDPAKPPCDCNHFSDLRREYQVWHHLIVFHCSSGSSRDEPSTNRWSTDLGGNRMVVHVSTKCRD